MCVCVNFYSLVLVGAVRECVIDFQQVRYFHRDYLRFVANSIQTVFDANYPRHLVNVYSCLIMYLETMHNHRNFKSDSFLILRECNWPIKDWNRWIPYVTRWTKNNKITRKEATLIGHYLCRVWSKIIEKRYETVANQLIFLQFIVAWEKSLWKRPCS